MQGHHCHHKYRVLLVSGNPTERRQWQDLLDEKDFIVSVADNGKVAFRAIQEGNLDLVIAAVTMAEIDGIELVRLVGTDKEAPPIIVIGRESGESGTPYRTFLKSAALAGATATYTQPLRAHDFLEGIRVALALERGPRSKPQ